MGRNLVRIKRTKKLETVPKFRIMSDVDLEVRDFFVVAIIEKLPSFGRLFLVPAEGCNPIYEQIFCRLQPGKQGQSLASRGPGTFLVSQLNFVMN